MPCEDVLLVRTLKSASSDKRRTLAWLTLVTRDNYDEAKKAGAAEVPDYFTGNFDEFAVKRQRAFEMNLFTYDEQEKTSLLQVGPADGAIEAWSECMRRNDTPLSCWVTDSDSSTVTFVVSWRPPIGAAALTNTSVLPNKGTVAKDTFTGTELAVGGQATLVLERPTGGGAVSCTVEGKLGVTQYRATVKAPRWEEPVPRMKIRKMEYRNVGDGTYATLSVGPFAFDQTVRACILNVAEYEQPGDPEAGVQFDVPGLQPFTSYKGCFIEERGYYRQFKSDLPGGFDVSAPGTIIANYSQDVEVKKGANFVVTGTVTKSHHSKARLLLVAIEYEVWNY